MLVDPLSALCRKGLDIDRGTPLYARALAHGRIPRQAPPFLLHAFPNCYAEPSSPLSLGGKGK
jgi:hypothetical protein